MADGIYDIEKQFVPGFMYNFPRVQAEEQWDQWYDRNYDTLLPSPTRANGLTRFKRSDLIRVGLFRWSSEYYQDALIGDQPTMTTDTPALEEWYKTFAEEQLMKALERAARWWSIKYRGVLVTHEDGTVIEINPSSYFREGQYYHDDEITGHVIAHRFFRPEGHQLLVPNQRQFPNYVRVLKYAPDRGINTVQTFRMEGLVQGNPVDEKRPAGITAIRTFGDGTSWYPDAQDVAARFLIRLTNNDRMLNRADNKVQFLPQGAQPDRKAGDRRTAQEQFDVYRDTTDPIMEVPGDTILRLTAQIDRLDQYSADASHLKDLLQQYYAACRLSPANFGWDIGANASGTSIERRQDSAGHLLRNGRRDILRLLPAIVVGMGAPPGAMNWAFLTGALEDKLARSQEINRDLELGIIDEDEARALKGYAKRETAQTTPTED